MKKLTDFTNKKYIALELLEDERFKAIRGQSINECCDNTCCSELKCCTYQPDEQNIVWFYNEREIVRTMNTKPKVQDIYNIHRQLNNDYFKFINEIKPNPPLYFKEYNPVYNGNVCLSKLNCNKSLNDFLIKLGKDNDMINPICLERMNNIVQLYYLANKGSNGAESSIKQSLIDMVQLMNTLEEYDEIKWVQVLDVAIDNVDDVYTYLVTIEIDITAFPENDLTKSLAKSESK